VSTEELFAALDACAERDRLLTRLAKATTDQDGAQRAADEARRKVSSETVDVKTLEEFGPTQLWSMLRGRHSTDLEREQAELAAALYQSRVAEGALSEASSVVRQLRSELAALGDVDARRRDAMDALEAELRQAGGPVAQELIDIAGRLAASLADSREVAEAQRAAETASARLDTAISELSHARDLADLDVFIGGGILVDAAKYGRIDSAVTQLQASAHALKQLSAELADLQIPAVPGLDIPALTHTFDVWFDDFFSGWSVRERIREAEASSRRAFDAVAAVSTELSRRSSELLSEQEQLAQQRLAVMAR